MSGIIGDGAGSSTSNHGDLPEGWVLAKLEDICFPPQYGWTTSADQNRQGVRLLRTTDISAGVVDWSFVPGCREEPENLEKYLLSAGDIVVSRAGSVGVSYLVKDCPKAIFASYLIRIRPLPQISSEFVGYFLQSPQYWETIAEESSGITIPNVNASKLKRIPIPLAPRAEQTRIVTKIGKLLVRVNATRERLARVPAILKRFRQAVLTAACSGRLTEDWRAGKVNTEDGATLLERILSQRNEFCEGNRSKKKWDNAAFEGRVLSELPDGWFWSTLAQVIDSGPQNGVYKPSSYYGDGIPIVRIEDFQDNFVPSKRDLLRLRLNKEETAKYQLRQDDILINRVNSPSHIGKCLLVTEDLCGAVFESNMMRLSVSKYLTPIWIILCLRSPEGRLRLTEGAKWAVNQVSINQTDVCLTRIPLPPVEEQQEIVTRTRFMFGLADTIDRRVAEATRRAERISDGILAKAFRGQLVPTEAELARTEGRSYEAASELLGRLMARQEKQGVEESLAR